MTILEIGSICIKKFGHEKNKQCVIVDIINKNYVLVTGPKNMTGVKRRRVNLNHLEYTGNKIKIKKGATDQEVHKAITKITK